jgi:uncharacterized membrane protein YccC
MCAAAARPAPSLADRAARAAALLREALRFAPVGVSVTAGLRAGVAMGVPLFAAGALGSPGLSWMGLAGFLVAIVDKGGAYRTRAAAMAWATLGACAACALGPLAGARFDASLLVAFAGATALSFVRIYGGGAASAGMITLVLLLVSIARPDPSFADALSRGASAGAGGVWAMLLALALWPVRLYRPARLAVARALRAVADLAADVASAGPDDEAAAALRARRAAVRAAIEEARSTLAATRRGRRGDTGRGERLLLVLESADQCFAALVALREVLAGLRVQGGAAEADASTPALDGVAADARRLADVVEVEGPDAPFALSPVASAEAATGDAALAATLVQRARALLAEAGAAAATLEDELPARPAAVAVEDAPSWREHWTWRSSASRHALRVGVTVALAVGLTHHFALRRGYWVTLAAAVILQPQLPATLSRAIQRVLGTVVGGVLAALLISRVHDHRVMLPLVFAMVVVSVSVQQINYALYSALLTPTFVLLAEAGAHEPGLVQARIVNTLLGGALALAGARLLWPMSERELFPNAAAEALDAARALAAAALAVEFEQAAFDAARREGGVALIEADASLQRWVAEAPGGAAEVEAPMAFVVYLRGLTSALVTLAAARVGAQPALAPLAGAVDDALRALRAAVVEGRAPAATADVTAAAGAAGDEPTLRRRAEHVALQAEALRGCVARWVGGGGRAPLVAAGAPK